jgi:hypothetical protein
MCTSVSPYQAVLQWAKQHFCQWNAMTCAYAAQGRVLQVDSIQTRVESAGNQGPETIV